MTQIFHQSIATLMGKRYGILLILFLCHLFLFWPGYLTSDSQGQYQMAIQGVYSDHHPFLMSFLWRYLDKIYQGPGLMLSMHLSLLYGSVYFLIKSLGSSKKSLFFLLLPWLPHLFSYSGMIWKDIGFAYAFLFTASYLTYCVMQDQRLPFFKLIGLLCVLVYGTLIKFQAQYLAPFLLLWVGLHVSKYTKGFLALKKTASIFVLFYAMIFSLQYFGPKVTENHSWQLVKLYDLAAISVGLDTPVMPKFSRTSAFSMGELHKRFNHQRVDDLVFKDPILKGGDDQEQREILFQAWATEVLKHPFLYLRHRAGNLGFVLLSTPWFEYADKALNTYCDQGLLYKSIYITARTLGYLFLAHFLPMLLSCVYLVLSIMSWGKTKAAIPLFFFNLLSVMMGSVLFFFSMAGTPRYTYIVVCLFHASHVFAYLCYKSIKGKMD